MAILAGVMTSGAPQNQHYVPQLLLRNFCCGEREQVYVFDKLEERVFLAGIKKIAGERHFYDLFDDGYATTLEPSLGEVESRTARIIQEVIRKESLPPSPGDRALLSVFAAVQLLRGPSPRKQVLETNHQLEAWLRKGGHEIGKIRGWSPIDEEGAKLTAMSILAKPGEFAIQFANKIWVLMRPPRGQTFYISDNPVVLQNSRPHHPLVGNLGLAVKGIEIYLPLAKTLTIAFLCPSHYSDLKDGLAKLHDQQAPHLAPTRAFLAGMEEGTPVNLGDQELLNLNGLQVAYAERYVYASTEGFQLAKEMIRDHPSLKAGPRLKGS